MAKDCIANVSSIIMYYLLSGYSIPQLPLTPDLVTKELLRHQDKLQGAVPATPSKRTRYEIQRYKSMY